MQNISYLFEKSLDYQEGQIIDAIHIEERFKFWNAGFYEFGDLMEDCEDFG